MKKVFCIMIVAGMILAAGCAMADQEVSLPNSSHTLTIPDGMAYDGPTPGTDEAFAYVSEQMGLQISFLVYNAPGADLTSLIPRIQEKNAEKVELTTVGGIPMIVYRITTEDGAKCIGYILQDGNAVQEIIFWYSTQKAADMSKTIMESIR